MRLHRLDGNHIVEQDFLLDKLFYKKAKNHDLPLDSFLFLYYNSLLTNFRGIKKLWLPSRCCFININLAEEVSNGLDIKTSYELFFAAIPFRRIFREKTV
jgi:hypothetical protein